MPRPRRITTADTLAPVPPEPADSPAPALPSPVAAVEAEPATPQPQRSAARQHLADTIAAVRALEAEARDAGAAVEPARSAMYAAQRALDDAEDVLRRARPREVYTPPPTGYSVWGSQAESDDAARRARAAAEAPPISIADAKAGVEVARDALDSARATFQWHEGRLSKASQTLGWKRSSIGDAVRLVLRDEPATLALAMECRRLKTRAEAARQAFGAILHGDIIQHGSPFYGWDHIADVRDGSPEAMADWTVSREWAAAVEALSSDPDAPLPAV